ncbi:retrotransposon protein, putative, ty1-copia subclass [Tanacetum coccineum]
MFEREKLSGSNFNDWFHSPKMVLRVEKKLFFIEQPIPLAPPADSKYLRSEMRFMMLIMRFLVLCSKYEKDLPKKAATPQVMAIQHGRIQKDNKKSLNGKAKGKGKSKGKDKSYIPKPKNPKPFAKEHPEKDDAYHHYKEVGHCKRNCPAYLAKLIKRRSKLALPVLQHTPPYTPQHNDVSKRRNRTLLDMVRSMMNLTTLPLSFRDYALDTATRILNMVPTKKVDKTPYELWYGKVPNLSYLKSPLVRRALSSRLKLRHLRKVRIQRRDSDISSGIGLHVPKYTQLLAVEFPYHTLQM